jgi:hypothetical protein
MFGLATIPAVLLFVGTLTRPESPRWLVTQGRDGDARRIPARYRPSDPDVDAEISELKALSWRQAKVSELLGPKVRTLPPSSDGACGYPEMPLGGVNAFGATSRHVRWIGESEVCWEWRRQRRR